MEKKEFIDFLKYIVKTQCDSYGHLQVLISDNEQLKKDYYSETPESIVDTYLKTK